MPTATAKPITNLSQKYSADEVSAKEQSNYNIFDFSEGEEDYKQEEPLQVYNLITSNLDDPQLTSILSQNHDLSKQTIYLLNNDETLKLFKRVSIDLSDNPNKSVTLGPWLRWLLLAKGNLLAKDKESTDVLKLVKSTLSENVKLLPNILALEGRLSLLQAQLKLRKQMVNQAAEINNIKKDGEAHSNGKAKDISVLMDGENNDSEFDDDDEVDEKEDDEEEGTVLEDAE